jgi:hypothetical protein
MPLWTVGSQRAAVCTAGCISRKLAIVQPHISTFATLNSGHPLYTNFYESADSWRMDDLVDRARPVVWTWVSQTRGAVKHDGARSIPIGHADNRRSATLGLRSETQGVKMLSSIECFKMSVANQTHFGSLELEHRFSTDAAMIRHLMIDAHFHQFFYLSVL